MKEAPCCESGEIIDNRRGWCNVWALIGDCYENWREPMFPHEMIENTKGRYRRTNTGCTAFLRI
jgi:hypothetical protein